MQLLSARNTKKLLVAIIHLEYIEITRLLYPNIEIESSEILKNVRKCRSMLFEELRGSAAQGFSSAGFQELAIWGASRIQAGNVSGIAFYQEAHRALCSSRYSASAVGLFYDDGVSGWIHVERLEVMLSLFLVVV